LPMYPSKWQNFHKLLSCRTPSSPKSENTDSLPSAFTAHISGYLRIKADHLLGFTSITGVKKICDSGPGINAETSIDEPVLAAAEGRT
jgi:hypothetical protein